MPNKRVKCPHWRKMLHPISIFSVFWWDGKFWPPFFFFFTTINQNRVHAFRGHFCHLCTSVISCLSFSIRINFWSNDCFFMLWLNKGCVSQVFFIFCWIVWKLLHSFWILSGKYKNGTYGKGWHGNGWQLSEPLNDDTNILTETDTETFFSDTKFSETKTETFFRNKIFQNRNRCFFPETKFSETETFFPRPNSPKPKPSNNWHKVRHQ